VAGDIYSAAPYVGRGGWSWYTGAAAWLHRAAIESLFGLDFGPHTLSFTPGLPSHWPQAEITLQREGRSLRVLMLRMAPAEALAAAAAWAAGKPLQVLLPGQALAWAELPAAACVVLPLGS
jgi:cyclic beta-1,2-glucan synthetase